MNREEELFSILEKNKSLQLVLEKGRFLEIPDWYVGSGGITQTVWNVLHGFEPEHEIKDYDLVYYDASDISYEAEDKVIKKGADLFKDIKIPVEIRNQARVHLWYRKEFGYETNQAAHTSCEESISCWPTTATAVGVRKESDGTCTICTPFGLDDVFGMIVRPNKPAITQKVYEDKVNRWSKVWPKLKIIPW